MRGPNRVLCTWMATLNQHLNLYIFHLFQVLTIWEGTTNILSLDVLRAVGKTGGGVLRTLHADIQRKLKAGEKRPELSEACSKISTATSEILQFAASTDQRTLEVAARDFAYGIARTYMGKIYRLLLVKFIVHVDNYEDLDVAR